MRFVRTSTGATSRSALGRVLDHLGTTLLDLAAGDPECARDIGGVVIHDPFDEPMPLPGALVLGVGVRGAAEITKLLERVAAGGGTGLIVRAPADVDDHLRETASRTGTVLLSLTSGASWNQLASLLRTLLGEGHVAHTEAETIGSVPAGDLFALANAISALLDAPITIEDRSNLVLAFSGRQDEADASRVATILGRRVPEEYTRILEERGAFQDLYRSGEPVFIDPMPDSDGRVEMPRVALAVRAGDEVLGSIWAAVRAPLSDERAQALCDAAKLVALHMMRLRASADVERRLRADLVGTALDAGPGAPEAVARLGLTDQCAVVLALETAFPPGEAGAARHARLAAERQRLADAFAVHLTAVHPRSAVALIGDTAYGIMPVGRQSPDADERVVRVAEEFQRRVGTRHRLLIGIGDAGTGHIGLSRSRTGADRALQVLRTTNDETSVARIGDVRVQSLLAELTALIDRRGDTLDGPVARLVAYDARHHTHLVDTLRAWLDGFGDVNAAAAGLYVHPNTFRYRLRRVAEIGRIDLGDTDARFAAMLHLRLQPPARPQTQDAQQADPLS